MSRGRLLSGLGVAIAVVAVDAWTKSWALDHARSWPPRSYLGGHLQLTVTLNPAWGFGLGKSLLSAGLLLAIPVVVAVVLVRIAMRIAPATPRVELATGLALGGMLGNLADRALRTVEVFGEAPQRVVVDFIVLRASDSVAWPAFNLADLAIAVGLPWVGLLWLRHRRSD